MLSDQRTWVDGNKFGYIKDVSCDFLVVLKFYGMECNFCQHVHNEIFIFLVNPTRFWDRDGKQSLLSSFHIIWNTTLVILVVV